jgi:hypothetical protein
MLEYARLARRGDTPIAARRALLDAHRVEVEPTITRLRTTLRMIENKLALYDRALATTGRCRVMGAGRVCRRSTRRIPARLGAASPNTFSQPEHGSRSGSARGSAVCWLAARAPVSGCATNDAGWSHRRDPVACRPDGRDRR